MIKSSTSLVMRNEGHVLYLEASLAAADAQLVAACIYSLLMTTLRFIQPTSVVGSLDVSACFGAAPAIAIKACPTTPFSLSGLFSKRSIGTHLWHTLIL